MELHVHTLPVSSFTSEEVSMWFLRVGFSCCWLPFMWEADCFKGSVDGCRAFYINWEIKPSVSSVVPTSGSHLGVKLKRRTSSHVSSGLPETAASIAVAAAVVGVAATILVRRQKASQENEIPMKTCEDCGGSGICSECRGEGFVLKKLSEESAERARLKAKNMATRYTAALPKKWSYCTMCSSARTCRTCGGSGKLSY